MAERCVATTKVGNPCGGTAVPGENLCPWHSPSWAERRRAWSVKGGQGKSAAARAKKHLPAEPLSNDELLGYLTVVFKGVITRNLDPKIGNSAIAIARGMVEIRNAGEVERLAGEVEELRTMLRRGGAA
jgi:hypothetical protein